MFKYLLPAALALLAPSLTPNLSAYDSQADLSTYSEMSTAYQKEDKCCPVKHEKRDNKCHEEKIIYKKGPCGPRGPKGKRGDPGKNAQTYVPTLYVASGPNPGLVFAGTPLPVVFSGGFQVSNTDDIIFISPSSFLLKEPGLYTVEIVINGAALAGTSFTITVNDSITQTFTTPPAGIDINASKVIIYAFKTFEPDAVLSVALVGGTVAFASNNSATIEINRVSTHHCHHHHHRG